MSLSQRQQFDKAIFNNIIQLPQYNEAKMLLTFVSMGNIEVDTHALIKHALSNGKQVVVPRCIPGTALMEFCQINSFDDLEPGTFSVLEPKKQTKIIRSFPNSICIVPGLSFDMQGYRLGFGGGYYDRFLNTYRETKIGICYSNCLQQALPHGRYDCTVDMLVTDKFSKTITPKKITFKEERDV